MTARLVIHEPGFDSGAAALFGSCARADEGLRELILWLARYPIGVSSEQLVLIEVELPRIPSGKRIRIEVRVVPEGAIELLSAEGV